MFQFTGAWRAIYLQLSLAFVPGTSENRMKMLCTPCVFISNMCRGAAKGTAVLPRTCFFSLAAGSPLHRENAMQKDSLGLGDPAQFFIVTAKSRRVKGKRKAELYIWLYYKTTPRPENVSDCLQSESLQKIFQSKPQITSPLYWSHLTPLVRQILQK